jgi:hypothetical protein
VKTGSPASISYSRQPGQSGHDGLEAFPCLGEALGGPLGGLSRQVPRRIQVDLVIEQVDDRDRAAEPPLAGREKTARTAETRIRSGSPV